MTSLLRAGGGRCREILLGATAVPCGATATIVSCDPGVPGRAIVSECLCDLHGGEARATEVVLSSWHVRAPSSVGDDVAVLDAGTATLASQHVYVVTRPEGDRFVASLGIGSHTTQVRRLDRDADRARKATPEHRAQHPTTRRRGGGSSWATREEAEAAGIEAWRAEIDRRVDEITAMRGGTLAWGLAVTPRESPILLRCERGQSGYAADMVRTLVEALPGAIVDRVDRATRIAVGRREIMVDDQSIVRIDGENWSGRGIAAIVAAVATDR